MSKILSVVTAGLLVWLSLAAAQTQKKTAPATSKAVPKKATTPPKKTSAPAAKKGTPASTTHTAAAAHGKKPVAKRPAVTWRNRQMAPSNERYREIQSALVQRGYLSSEAATGAWNQESVDALKKFQAEQNLETSGKINSLSLIALGLGPKRDSAPIAPPKAPADHGPGQ